MQYQLQLVSTLDSLPLSLRFLRRLNKKCWIIVISCVIKLPQTSLIPWQSYINLLLFAMNDPMLMCLSNFTIATNDIISGQFASILAQSRQQFSLTTIFVLKKRLNLWDKANILIAIFYWKHSTMNISESKSGIWN